MPAMTVRASPNNDGFLQSHGYARSNPQSAIYTSPAVWLGDQGVPISTNGKGAAKARFPHIKDLQGKANAAIKNTNPRLPVRQYPPCRFATREQITISAQADCVKIHSLLSLAQQSANQVGIDVSFKRQDRAYVEYLVSSELLLNAIPKHKDYPSLISDGGERHRVYKTLRKVSNNLQA